MTHGSKTVNLRQAQGEINRAKEVYMNAAFLLMVRVPKCEAKRMLRRARERGYRRIETMALSDAVLLGSLSE